MDYRKASYTQGLDFSEKLFIINECRRVKYMAHGPKLAHLGFKSGPLDEFWKKNKLHKNLLW